MAQPKTVTPADRGDDPLLVDDERLDFEVNDQPRRARAAGERLADADYAVARSKASLDLMKAELMVDIRGNPAAYDLSDAKAPPMDIVEATVVIQLKYQQALLQFHNAEHERDVARVEWEALRMRKGMLERRIELHVTNYHSEPRTPEARTAAARTNRQGIDR